MILIDEPRVRPKTPPKGFALFALGFRPFFLLGALFAAVAVPLWVALYGGGIMLSPVLPGMLWHGHEMVFGFAGAIIAGFLLTAVKNWTGMATPSGGPLAGLVLLWLAGRLLMFSGQPILAAVVDIAFFPVLAAVLARVLLKSRNRRNYFVPVLLLALATANVLTHAGVHGWLPVSPMTGLHLAVALITLLETVIAGRIVPGFTANALRTVPWRNVWVDRTAIAATGLALVLWALDAAKATTGGVAALALVAQMVRVWGWRPLPTLRVPLLWILHLSHGWILVALLLLVLDALGATGSSAVLHVLTVGATGGLIIAMITRTALGHTGRLLQAGRRETAAYLLLHLSVGLRLLPLLGLAGGADMIALWGAAVAWSGCFALYVSKYVAILVAPRVDGRPG